MAVRELLQRTPHGATAHHKVRDPADSDIGHDVADDPHRTELVLQPIHIHPLRGIGDESTELLFRPADRRGVELVRLPRHLRQTRHVRRRRTRRRHLQLQRLQIIRLRERHLVGTRPRRVRKLGTDVSWKRPYRRVRYLPLRAQKILLRPSGIGEVRHAQLLRQPLHSARQPSFDILDHHHLRKMRLHLRALVRIVVKEHKTVRAHVERLRRRQEVAGLRFPIHGGKREVSERQRHVRTCQRPLQRRTA